METRWKNVGIQVVLLFIFIMALGYLGRVGMALRPTPSPTPTVTPTPTPLPTPVFFDGRRAYWDVVAQVSFGPRVPGSDAARKARAHIRQQLVAAGWDVEEIPFTYRGISLINVLARRGSGPVTIIGAHYDSRPQADRDNNPSRRMDPVPGANDGASGVAVLLELARVLQWDESRRAVWLYFFDAEDHGGIDGWSWAVGARHAARTLPQDVTVEAVIVVDMIGDRDQRIYYEGNSHAGLQEALWRVAQDLGYGNVFIPQIKYTVIDDHLPFVERGIPAVDIIDFEYTYWHTTADTPDKVSPLSLERVGRVVEHWFEQGP